MFLGFKRLSITNFPLRKMKGIKFYLYASLRVGYLGIREFVKNNGPQISSSLTYYTLLAIVPILALSLHIAEKFGLEDFLEKGLLEHFSEQKEILEKILTFTHNMLETAQSGIVAAIGLSLFFISAIKLLSNMELFFNSVWGIESRRNVKNKIFIYILLILIIPIFLVISGGIRLLIIQKLDYFVEQWPFLEYFKVLIKLLPNFLIWCIFTITYVLLPKAKVKFSLALLSAVITGTIYGIAQWIYLSFQIGVANCNAIYSSFAVLPLFLIWLHLSWMIFLFGAELNSIMNNIYRCEFEKTSKKTSIHYRLLISILIVLTILKSKERVTQSYLYKRQNIPFALSSRLLKKMLNAKLLKETKTKKLIFYEPNFDPSIFKINELINKLRSSGVNEIEFIEKESISKIDKILNRLEEASKASTANILVKDLCL
jgi:membrane protein